MTRTRYIAVGLVLAALIGAAALFLVRRQAPVAAPSGAVSVRIESFALNLTPSKLADTESRRIASALHLGLVRVAQDGSVLPGAAVRWEKKNGRWTFTLAAGKTYTNGVSITPESVVASLCASMQPTSQWAWALASIDQKASADAKSVDCTGLKALPDAVEIVETSPAPWLLDALSGPAGWLVPTDAVPEPYGVVPGAGPYRVERVQADREVVLTARAGGPVEPALNQIRFVLVQDDAAVSKQFANGDLDVVEVNTPALLALMAVPAEPETALKPRGTVIRGSTDRVRLLLLGEKGLAAKGMGPDDIQSFKARLHSSIDRAAVSRLSGGIGQPLSAAVPLADYTWSPAVEPVAAVAKSGNLELSIITEADPFSDLIAAEVVKAGAGTGAKLTYRGVDKGLLIKSLLSGEYELASIVLDATLRSPQYWKAFFTPGNPFTAFGKALPSVGSIDARQADAPLQLAEAISREGTWVGLLVERKVVAVSPGMRGLRLSPSGQVNYESIARQ
jgi:hypothetical protein